MTPGCRLDLAHGGDVDGPADAARPQRAPARVRRLRRLAHLRAQGRSLDEAVLPLAWPVGRRVERVAGVPASLPDVGRSGTFCFISADNRDRCTIVLAVVVPRLDDHLQRLRPRRLPGGRAAQPTRPWSWRMVNAGRLDPRKGLETAVRALPLLPGGGDAGAPAVGRRPVPRRTSRRSRPQLGVGDRLRFTLTTRDRLRDALHRGRRVRVPHRVGRAVRARAPRGDGVWHAQ